MFLAVTLVFLSCALVTSVHGKCISYLNATPTDVVFAFDVSEGIFNENSFLSFRDNIFKSLIIKTMRIGPDLMTGFTRIAAVKFDSDAAEVAFDLIRTRFLVYESEFFAPDGIFDRSVVDSAVTAAGSPTTGMERAIRKVEPLLLHTTTTHKILYLVTDAILSSADEQQNVTTALATLRTNILNLDQNLTFQAYGIGVGSRVNLTNLRELISAATSDPIIGGSPQEPLEGSTGAPSGDCSAREGWEYIRELTDLATISVKGGLGADRLFSDPMLCCAVCEQKNRTFGNCSLQEFNKFDHDISDDLKCDVVLTEGGGTVCRVTTTIRDLCASEPCFNGATCSMAQYTFLCFCAPGYIGEHCEIESDDDDDDDDNTRTTSALLVIFGLINLVLIIMFILIAICSRRLTHKWKKPNRTPNPQQGKSTVATQREIRRTRLGTIDHPQASQSGVAIPADVTVQVTPSRPAPGPPLQQRADIQPPGYNTAIRNTVHEHQAENIYNNDGTDEFEGAGYSDDYQIPDEVGGDYENVDITRNDPESGGVSPQTFWGLLREDTTRHIRKLRNSMGSIRHPAPGGALSQTALQSQIPLPGSSQVTPRPKAKPRSPFHKLAAQVQNRLSRNYQNSDTIQELHDRKQQKDPTINANGAGGELQAKLQRRKQQTDPTINANGAGRELQAQLQRRREMSENVAIETDQEIQDTAGTDYENVFDFRS